MSSSIEEQFQPPEWATKEEVIKAACHYINYWKIEARQRNQQWLDAMDANARLKADIKDLREDRIRMCDVTIEDIAVIARLKAEVERLRASSFVTAVPVEQYERVIKAGDAVCESPYLWETDPAVIEWRAAKEGKPSV